ncbi:unnamed protein product [Rotaria magnacalcarata]|nr:unnamed protein product [Rotaria magnacalcarata]
MPPSTMGSNVTGTRAPQPTGLGSTMAPNGTGSTMPPSPMGGNVTGTRAPTGSGGASSTIAASSLGTTDRISGRRRRQLG